MGTQGSASHNFQQFGVIKIDKSEISDEKIFELALESGSDECFSNQHYHEIHCDKNEIYNVKKRLEKNINNFLSTEIEWIPINNIEIPKEEKEYAIKFLETLEEDDDIQNVYTNLKF